MRIAGIIENSIVDGVGIRTVLFMQGCTHKCKNCHNPQTWPLEKGELVSQQEIMNTLSSTPYNITISGGEPFLQQISLLSLVKEIKETTAKTIWIYSGFTFEEICKLPYGREILEYVDVLVDGKFVEELKSEDLIFKGSSNQRIIDVQSSLKARRAIAWKRRD